MLSATFHSAEIRSAFTLFTHSDDKIGEGLGK